MHNSSSGNQTALTAVDPVRLNQHRNSLALYVGAFLFAPVGAMVGGQSVHDDDLDPVIGGSLIGMLAGIALWNIVWAIREGCFLPRFLDKKLEKNDFPIYFIDPNSDTRLANDSTIEQEERVLNDDFLAMEENSFLVCPDLTSDSDGESKTSNYRIFYRLTDNKKLAMTLTPTHMTEEFNAVHAYYGDKEKHRPNTVTHDLRGIYWSNESIVQRYFRHKLANRTDNVEITGLCFAMGFGMVSLIAALAFQEVHIPLPPLAYIGLAVAIELVQLVVIHTTKLPNTNSEQTALLNQHGTFGAVRIDMSTEGDHSETSIQNPLPAYTAA